jgi:predicted O-methyltransferase YrrM
LYQHNNVFSNSLAKALDAALRDDVSGAEKMWIEKIESLRRELLASWTEISIVDYGAGLPALDLTPAEMNQGTRATMTIRDVCRSASLPRKWALLLFKLVRQFRPLACVELGTCLGISTAYQAAALELNQRGRIVTCEGDESLASLAKRNFRALGLQNVSVRVGRFHDLLGGVLREIKHPDFAFIDGHHEEQATLAYFRQICPYLAENSVFVLDDISWSRGMRKAWELIVADGRARISVDLSRVGICIISNSPSKAVNSKYNLIEKC